MLKERSSSGSPACPPPPARGQARAAQPSSGSGSDPGSARRAGLAQTVSAPPSLRSSKVDLGEPESRRECAGGAHAGLALPRAGRGGRPADEAARAVLAAANAAAQLMQLGRSRGGQRVLDQHHGRVRPRRSPASMTVVATSASATPRRSPQPIACCFSGRDMRHRAGPRPSATRLAAERGAS